MGIRSMAFLLAFLMAFIITNAQKQDLKSAPVFYEVSGLVYVYDYDVTKRTQLASFKIPKPSLKFEIVRKERNDAEKYDFVIIKFLPIINDIVSNAGVKMSLTNNDQYLNSEDNRKYFWIKQDELNNLMEEKAVKKRFKLSSDLAYGANVSLPLKVRPKYLQHNVRFSPDISLGGYLGFRHRISRREAFFVSIPYVSAGLTTLPLTADTDGATPSKGDGIMLGVTGSAGIVFHLKNLQLGFLAGRDKAAGELGRTWIYNNKTWYAFSIGFSFLGNNHAMDK
jgi:hypothetical protein